MKLSLSSFLLASSCWWFLGMGTATAQVTDTLIQTGAVWKYLDDGSDQGTAWQAPAFNDNAWSSGAAQLG
ncbi:MAG: hypothetical protein ACI841_002208, partial [Planctomycetota bacterium]